MRAGVTNTIADLYVAIDDYGIFYADEEGRVCEWWGTGTGFAEQPFLDRVERVWVVGSRHAAEFLQRIYVRRQQTGSPLGIKIAGPDYFCLEGPVPEILNTMRTLEFPPSVGGWHEMTSGDYQSYALIHELERSQGRMTDVANLLLDAHPASAAIEFVSGASREYCAWLLAEMIDPRWYVDPQAPERSGRLKSRFGLVFGRGGASQRAAKFFSPRRESAGLDWPKTAMTQAARADLVFNAWAQSIRSATVPDVAKLAFGPTSDSRQFLRRGYCVAVTKVDKAQALLQLSHRFLQFLTSVWLTELTGWELFVPEYFFANVSEVAGWHKHMSRRKSVTG